jgi:hypothetical protein
MKTKITFGLVIQPVALMCALSLSAPAWAVKFSFGEVEGQFDSSLSVGASWSVRKADPTFVSAASGGKAAGRIGDDGRLNFKKGETYSKTFKGIHDLQLTYGDTGVFVRGKYWYDFETKDERRQLYDIDDRGRKEAAQASGAQILDAFVFFNYRLGGLPGGVRVGKQVVSWGESTFIQNSINSINPKDVAALHRAGAKAKEGIIPVNMLYVQQGLTQSISAEAFYQLEWDQTVIANCGTFQSTADGVPDGCTDRLVVAGPDLPPGDSNNTGAATGNNLYIPRTGDRDARDSGQFGVALRWVAEDLNNTKFAAYSINYHSRMPILSANQSTGPSPTSARYFLEYPEDIRLYGLSFATTIGGTAVSGEVSYRPNQPMQINGPDLLSAAFGSPLSPVVESGHIQPGRPGTDIHGYERKAVSQAQITVIHFIDEVFGANRLSMTSEVGYNHINGLDKSVGSLRFGRDTLFGIGELSSPAACPTSNVVTPQYCNNKGYLTSNSWGYRTRAKLDYRNAIAGINLSPSMVWSHDVDGYGPNFNEGSKAISLGLDAEYLGYTASLNYTDFFGGDYNTITDRDFVTLSFGVNF